MSHYTASDLKSLYETLKHAIGNDLSKISIPILFNEPTSLLMRCIEFARYHDLLKIVYG